MSWYPVERIRRLERYIAEGFPTIWSQSVPAAMWLTQRYDVALHARGIDGAVAEIGVLRGAFIIGLTQLLPDKASSLAIDCFDTSGYELELPGDRAVLGEYLANVGRWAYGPEAAGYIAANSGTLNPVEVAREYGRVFKFFAVDGLHTENQTLHDLRIAEAALVPGGMIILDDWKDGCQPVVAAAEAFIADGRFAPVAYGFNKLWLAQNEYVDVYQTIRFYPRCRLIEIAGRTVPQVGPSDPYNPGEWFN